MQLYLELTCFSCKLLCLIFFGECYVYCKFIACTLADNLLLKAGNKLSASDCKVEILSLAALKSFSVNKSLKVDYCYIAVLYGSVLYCYKSAVSVPYLFDFLIDKFFCYFCRLCNYFDSFVSVYVNLFG